MNNDYCLPLDIEFPLFNSDLNPIDFLKSQPQWRDNVHTDIAKAAHFKIEYDLLSKDVQQFFLDHDQNLVLCEVFYRLPYGKSKIHVDRSPPGDYAKINWVFGGADSCMHWYTPKDEFQNKTAATSTISTPYIAYAPSEVDLVYSVNLRKPSLLQVGVPHSVTNGNQERFAVCMVFFDNRLHRRPTVTEAKEIFKNYLI